MTNAHFLSSVLGPGQVLPGGDLDVCVVALYQLHRTARQLEQAAVVGDEAGAGLVQFIQRRQIGCAVEALGRLHRIKGAAVGGVLHHAAFRHSLAVAALRLLDGVLHRHCRGGGTAAGSGRYRIGDNALAHEGPGRVVDGHQSAVGSGHAAAGALGAGRAALHQPHRLFAAGSGPLGILTGRAGHDHQLVHLRTLVKGPDAPLQDGLTAQIEAQFIKSHPGGRTSRHQDCRHTTFQFLTPAPFYSCPAPHCTEHIIIH